jgi:hypothetical protein
MTNRTAKFRQTDLKRALCAAKAAGLEVKQVELDPATGKIIITTTAGERSVVDRSALDDWLATHARSS